MATSPGPAESSEGICAAVLTTTILRSPVVKTILHARIRDRRSNTVVFVGDAFIHVKEVKEQQHLEHVVTKCDFDATIRAARTFTIDPQTDDEPSFIKKEEPSFAAGHPGLPPQCLVLTLDSNDIMFLYLRSGASGEHRLVHQTCPMPTFDRTLFQPGEHLAVDVHSRALATAANEREVVMYAAKSPGRIQHEIRRGDPDWYPLSAQRPIQVDGVIQDMEFLMPPSDDADHVILLLIVLQNKKTRAMWIDWQYNSGIHHANVHDGLPLDQPPSVSGLLIPLRNASFLLTNGNEIKRFANLLSGSTACHDISITDEDPVYPGESPRRAMWTNWSRPERGVGANDHLYLAREDGNIFLVEERDGASVMVSCNAGNMDCQIGTAFASVGGLDDPDILVAPGDMSTGCVKSIGSRYTPVRVQNLSRSETMDPQLIERIPNWASVTDMVASQLPGKSQRLRDGLFVTSGRQPVGNITEIRYGLEARLSVYLSSEDMDLRSVRRIWTLPLAGVGDLIVVLSRPGSTDFLKLWVEDGEMKGELLEPSSLDSYHETLLAVTMPDGRLVQVTEKSVHATTGPDASFEDRARIDIEEDDAILAAACDINSGRLITAERSRRGATGHALVLYNIPGDESPEPSRDALTMVTAVDIPSEPLAIACLGLTSREVTFATTVHGELAAFSTGQDGAFIPFGKTRLPAVGDQSGMCDSVAIVRAQSSTSPAIQSYLVVCGLRDGRVCCSRTEIAAEISFAPWKTIEFSQSSVKLIQPSEDASTMYAMSGMDTCLLAWDGRADGGLRIENIWISDKARPEWAQAAITACTRAPPAHLLSSPELAASVVFLSGEELLFADLQRNASAVPRQISVSGTPNRLVYLEQQRCLTSASLAYGIRTFSSSPFERRQVWPVIDFIPSKSSEPSFSYDMQPGERVYALLEWSFRQDDDKVYSFVLVGGSYVSARSQSTRGRITFLQPTNRNWEVIDVKEGRHMKFDEPVYALALLDPLTFIACTGHHVVVRRFNVVERKWQATCPPFTLHSFGTNITVDHRSHRESGTLISIATTSDSLVILRLDALQDSEDGLGYRLQQHCTAPKADSSLHHLPLEDSPGTTLITTKDRKLIGLQQQGPHGTCSRILFEALLPRSLTRIRQSRIRPPWKPQPPSGAVVDNIIACSADGTLTGAVLLDDSLWRRLSWLQRLCEWSARLSPHSHQTPPYSVSEQTFARNERGLPIGFAVAANSEIVMRTGRKACRDRHVDGDILARVLEHGGAECLREMVREAAGRRDAVGEWMRAHLDKELAAVEEVVGLVEALVGGWW